MKTSVPVLATAGVATAAIVGILYASQVASQPRSLDLAMFTPIRVVQTTTGTQTIAWVLDVTNRRVVMCTQKLNEINTGKIERRSGDLPSC